MDLISDNFHILFKIRDEMSGEIIIKRYIMKQGLVSYELYDVKDHYFAV